MVIRGALPRLCPGTPVGVPTHRIAQQPGVRAHSVRTSASPALRSAQDKNTSAFLSPTKKRFVSQSSTHISFPIDGKVRTNGSVSGRVLPSYHLSLQEAAVPTRSTPATDKDSSVRPPGGGDRGIGSPVIEAITTGSPSDTSCIAPEKGIVTSRTRMFHEAARTSHKHLTVPVLCHESLG
ncbi:hypothetical protein NDU88_008995 [Pleurodeles waltl]|uniref:Uncharacterized protein n=1 Tax=Pleurodeles waltl TaxID=8319 RepID=A0AAV7RUU7_PLEWA|nr:hypothetical protein NDU88_008995 [Pleurodeles waltl]